MYLCIMKNKKCGIYLITNTIVNKYYVGSSKNIMRRWIQHKNKLKGQVHCNILLQNAYDKYGISNFNFQILEECIEQDLIEKELYWVNKYNSMDHNIGYNILKPGEYPLLDHKKTKKSLRIKAIEEGKQIELIDVITLKLIDRLPLLTDVCIKYKLNRKKASRALTGEKPQYKGYILQHQDKPKDLTNEQLRARRYTRDQNFKTEINFTKKDLTEWRKNYNRVYWKTYKKTTTGEVKSNTLTMGNL